MQLLRTCGGYAGWTDDQLLDLPYSRFMQAVRVASKKEADAKRDRLLDGAFIGWQVVGSLAGSEVGSFPRYAKRLGVLPHTPAPVLTPEEAQAARERQEQEAARVIAAFSKA